MKQGEIIASLIVRLNENQYEDVKAKLESLKNLELHSYEQGKQVISIILPDENGLISYYRTIKNIEGVLSVELVFCGFDDKGAGPDGFKTYIPEWLNNDVDAGEIRYNGAIPKSLF